MVEAPMLGARKKLYRYSMNKCFYIPINDDNLGGSIWIRHIGDTLKQLGHDVRYCHFESDTSAGDYVIIQSEWIEKEAYKTARKAIVLLGHFTSIIYPDSTKLRKNDVVLTQWKGEVIEDWEKRSGLKTHYFPHGYFPNTCDGTQKLNAVWIGTDTPFRDTSWFDSLAVHRIQCEPYLVDGFYKNASICPNRHLNIQLGKLIDVPDSILNVPGMALNERTWWICGAGGFQITDNPLVRDFFGEDEVALATSKEDYQEVFHYYLAHPEKRIEMSKKAQEHTLREYTYKNNIEKILIPCLVS